MALNRAVLFGRVRTPIFGGRMTQSQVDGVNRIVDYREANYPTMRDDAFAYLLATVTWETGHKMQPVPEGGGEAYLRSKSYYPWYGRGLVQITHLGNYSKYGCANNPNPPAAMLDWPMSLKACFDGMTRGVFTGKKLDDYFTATKGDFVGARRIINGMDRAATIASIAETWHDALVAAAAAPITPNARVPVPVSPTSPAELPAPPEPTEPKPQPPSMTHPRPGKPKETWAEWARRLFFARKPASATARVGLMSDSTIDTSLPMPPAPAQPALSPQAMALLTWAIRIGLMTGLSALVSREWVTANGSTFVDLAVPVILPGAALLIVIAWSAWERSKARLIRLVANMRDVSTVHVTPELAAKVADPSVVPTPPASP